MFEPVLPKLWVERWSDMAEKMEWVEEQGRERADAVSRAKHEAR